MVIRFYASLVLLTLFAFAACQQQSGSRKRMKARDTTHYTKQEYIEQSLDSNFVNSFLQGNASYDAYDEYIRNFYRKRDFHYAWINKDGLTEQAGNFINMMKNDATYGIKDSSLMNPELQKLTDTLLVSDVGLKPGNPAIPRIEMLLTAQFFAYGNKVWSGITADSAKDLEWFIPRKKIDMESLLDSMMNKKGNAFEDDEPVNRQYKLLRGELKKLANLEATTKWDSLKATTKTFKKGDSDTAIAQVKIRLEALGDLPGTDSSGRFTAALDTAVRSFQHRMGLKSDGIIKQSVLTALNVPLQQRIRQVLLNMERLRWVPIEPATDYILVNIPEFEMHVYEKGNKLVWSCNVVVGKPGASTVIFSKELRHVVFSPYWNVPPGILAKEVLPGLKRGAGSYLARQNMEIVGASGKTIAPGSINWSKYSGGNFPYVVRQKPGGRNSLGKVKFLFPNEYNIYLHDTPARYLFGENKRSFSHGCIRVAEPKHLAEWLLRADSSWTSQKIDEAMNAGKEKYVTVKDKVPVFIGYFTAFVDSYGRLNFRDDVYGHDARLAATLFGK
ncbi:L,D-transpeptidase family protein [Chitinophaga nivalis]|uniref:L,D-transpeptidase family protein n=1 Tax=Chitinophaga nivalis TaxID=2991709 RepID=A0ABT3IVU1_9BACT|nr:L,D-transpeptidase family protein [Chitinophaga nivalis]MCW3462208.1 L,D-transpeptidase family protein [Chitinophaga nivalis]MCW3488100.1 L,D-transpeptidase family protein [Chitinophaga nivalis]